MRLFGGHNTRSSLGRTNDLLVPPSEPRPLEAKREKGETEREFASEWFVCPKFLRDVHKCLLLRKCLYIIRRYAVGGPGDQVLH